MLKKNSHRLQKSKFFSQNGESLNVTTSIKLNQNPDAWLVHYETTILDLVREKEAVQFIDTLMGNNEAPNHCIADKAYAKSQELNKETIYEISQMAQFQAFTMAGLQAKAKVLKAVTAPLKFDEGFVSYEVSMLFTSLLMDTLAGVCISSPP